MTSYNVVSTPLTIGVKFCKDDGFIEAKGLIYRSMMGSHLYLSTTRLDIMFATSLLSKFMQAPSILHFIVAKRILRYVKDTVDFGIKYLN